MSKTTWINFKCFMLQLMRFPEFAYCTFVTSDWNYIMESKTCIWFHYFVVLLFRIDCIQHMKSQYNIWKLYRYVGDFNIFFLAKLISSLCFRVTTDVYFSYIFPSAFSYSQPLWTLPIHSPRPHSSVFMASILRTSTWFYFLPSRAANPCMCFQTEDVTTTDHFSGIKGTSVRKME